MSRTLVSVEPTHSQTGCNRQDRKHYIVSSDYTESAAATVLNSGAFTPANRGFKKARVIVPRVKRKTLRPTGRKPCLKSAR
jgi:hypothetical protein